MFACTFLLSACVLDRVEGQHDFVYPENGDGSTRLGWPAGRPVEQPMQELGMPAPTLGIEGHGCRNTPGDECDSGLWCAEYSLDGTSRSGICLPGVRPRHNRGGINEECNRAPLAPCNHDYLQGVWNYDRCTCQRRSSQTGNANQKCNTYGAPCNHSNLRPHWVQLLPSGEACTCQYFLGSTSDNHDDSRDNADSRDVDSSDENRSTRSTTTERLGVRAPAMGGWWEPCRNTPGNECDYGLRCQTWTRWDGSSQSGRCVIDWSPHHHSTGGVNEPCNQPPVAPCNSNNLVGTWNYGQCTCQYSQENQTGEAGGKCNKAPLSPCNHSNLQAHWVQLLPSGEACTCEYLLGSTASSTDEPSLGASAGVTTLGQRAPEMGGEGEPCFNTPGHECNDGMYCKYTNHGSWTSGVCLRQYMPQFGKKGQPCAHGQCDSGLFCKVTWHGSFSTNVCEEQHVNRGHTGEQCNLLGSSLPECLSDSDYCKTVHLLPSGTTRICTRRTAQAGERCGDYARSAGMPTQCDSGLVCKSHRMYPSGTAQICEEPPAQGGVNQPCRSNVFNPCDESLVCNYFATDGPTCIYWLGDSGSATAPTGGN